MIATFSVFVWVVGSNAWWVRTRLPIMSSSRLKFIFTLCSAAGTWENTTPSEIPHKHTTYTTYLFKSCNLLLCHFFSFWTNHCTCAGNKAALLVCGNESNPRQQSGMSKPKSHISLFSLLTPPPPKKKLDLVKQTQEWLNLRAHRGFLSFIQLKASSCFAVRKAS